MDHPEPSLAVGDQRLVGRLRSVGPCTWLLGALILLLVAYPMVGESPDWALLMGVLNSAVLVSGAWAASRTRRTLILAFCFALPALALQWLWVVGHDLDVGVLLIVTLMVFYTFAIGHLMIFVLRPGPVTGNKLHGAVSAFVMLGLLWAFLYKLFDVLTPGCFVDTVTQQPQRALQWGDFVFFSFTTLSTTGYGDIVPLSGHAQSATILEQLAGILYVAVLIARLAGLYQPRLSSHAHEP